MTQFAAGLGCIARRSVAALIGRAQDTILRLTRAMRLLWEADAHLTGFITFVGLKSVSIPTTSTFGFATRRSISITKATTRHAARACKLRVF